ncbi:MAG: hypothetical protein C0476_02265 [Sphingomonas sp.]|nr:hypothetical protein [Sphingomonas sp.]
MQVVSLDTGHVSCEFDAALLPEVMKVLKSFGALDVSQIADARVIDVAGSQLVLTGGWEGTSLISTSDRGNAMIRQIAALLDHEASPQAPQIGAEPDVGSRAHWH